MPQKRGNLTGIEYGVAVGALIGFLVGFITMVSTYPNAIFSRNLQWETLLTGLLAIISAGIGAHALFRVSNRQVEVLIKQRDDEAFLNAQPIIDRINMSALFVLGRSVGTPPPGVNISRYSPVKNHKAAFRLHKKGFPIASANLHKLHEVARFYFDEQFPSDVLSPINCGKEEAYDWLHVHHGKITEWATPILTREALVQDMDYHFEYPSRMPSLGSNEAAMDD